MMIEEYLTAFNKTYGEGKNLLSNKNGIVGIIWQAVSPDSSNLAKEL
jgi:hypothetical protein